MEWRSWVLPGGGRPKATLDSLIDPREEDLERIAELEAAGSKMRLPHPLRNFIEFPTDKAARVAMDALAQEGYACQLRSVAEARWLVIAVIQLVPRPGLVTRMRTTIEGIAGNLDGRYDGWQSPAVY